MCGIAGIINFNYNSKYGASHLQLMSESIKHRGPDDNGYLTSGYNRELKVDRNEILDNFNIGFAHRRLSIIDLSDGGFQPMITSDKKYGIVFNGEIYNYLELKKELEVKHDVRFNSKSDTEVLLYALIIFGTEALNKLTGMFAFAFIDFTINELLLCRDPFGIKPLFYSNSSDSFLFSSEIKAILEVKKDIKGNNQRIFEYLLKAKTDHGSDTMFSEIHQVAPGSYLKINLISSAISPKRYWSLDINSKYDGSYNEAVTLVRDSFIKNIELHLRSDVTVGAALSGGIDSSSIVSTIRHLYSDLEIHTFSYISEDEKTNEEKWIDLVNKELACNANKIVPDPNRIKEEILELVKSQDEPFGSTSIYAQKKVFELVKEQNIKVILDGQGGDELFAGYEYYHDLRFCSLLNGGEFISLFNQLKTQSSRTGINLWELLFQTIKKVQRKKVKYFFQHFLRFNTDSGIEHQWFFDRNISPLEPMEFLSQIEVKKNLKRSMEEFGLSWLLRYEDRNSMAYSIESRVPFLTPNMAELIISFPESYFVSKGGVLKGIFRDAMSGITSNKILDRSDKIGFETPEKNWLIKNDSWVNEIIYSMNEIPFLNSKEVFNEWDCIKKGRVQYNKSFWRKLNLTLWTQIKNVRFK